MKKVILKILSIILGVVLLDQITKGFLLYLITGNIPLCGPAWEIVSFPYLMTQVCDFFNIVFTWNPGTSFSMLRAVGEAAPLIIIIATGFIIGFIGYYLFTRAPSYERWPLALIVGGALGNLIDRIFRGYVVDFIDVNFFNFPNFNVADISIIIGIGILLIVIIKLFFSGKTLKNYGKK